MKTTRTFKIISTVSVGTNVRYMYLRKNVYLLCSGRVIETFSLILIVGTKIAANQADGSYTPNYTYEHNNAV